MKLTKMKINFVESCQATGMKPEEITWDELREILKQIHRKGEMSLSDYFAASDSKKKTDKDGTAWIPCSAIDPAGKRTQANMDMTYLMVLDIDTAIQLADVKDRIGGYEAVIHSSYSHSPEHPKWRVVLPFTEPVPAKEIGKIFDSFQERFEGQLDAACGHDPSRLYYTPACPADAEHLFHYEHIEGEHLDGKAILMAGASSVYAPPVAAVAPSHASVSVSAGIAAGGRNSAAFKIAARLFGDGLDFDQVLADVLIWNERNDPPLDAKEVSQVVKSAMKTVARKVLAATTLVDAVVIEMNERFAWVRKPHQIYRFDHRDFVNIETLRHEFANVGMRVRVGDGEKWQSNADIWYRSSNRRTHTNVDFVPGAPAIVDNKINLWQGWGATAVAGDVTPWIAFMDYLFAGDPDARKWVEQWLAYPLQHPGAKLTTAIVLWSIKQGVGKSMLGDTVGKLYGNHFKTISAVELHASFNGWMRDVQFVLGEENSSSDQRADANRLKAMITGTTVFVNEKYQPALELPNCANFVFTSNHPDAFHLDDADRRFFVWEIAAARESNAFYDEFIDWRDKRGGMNALMHHLQSLDLTGFVPKGNAPMTAAKVEMISQSKSDLDRWINDTFEDGASVALTFGKQVTSLDEITETYNRQRHCRTSSTAVSRAFRKQHRYVQRKVSTLHGRKKLMSIADHDRWELEDNANWSAEFDKSSPLIMHMSI